LKLLQKECLKHLHKDYLKLLVKVYLKTSEKGCFEPLEEDNIKYILLIPIW
jgi:hypothetical protein